MRGSILDQVELHEVYIILHDCMHMITHGIRLIQHVDMYEPIHISAFGRLAQDGFDGSVLDLAGAAAWP